jgi:hypothetical protein
VKKYLSMLIIAIMAVAVLSAAGIVTTQKAAANGVQYIAVDYKPGAIYTYLPKQYNARGTGGMFSDNPKHFEAATGGSLYASISTRAGQAGGNDAHTGTWWLLKLPVGSTWDDIKGNRCKVTMKVNYHIAAKGANAKAAVEWGTVFPRSKDSVQGTDSKSVITSYTWDGLVKDLFVGPFPDGSIEGSAMAYAFSQSSDLGQASAALICSSIVLEFPAS